MTDSGHNCPDCRLQFINNLFGASQGNLNGSAGVGVTDYLLAMASIGWYLLQDLFLGCADLLLKPGHYGLFP